MAAPLANRLGHVQLRKPSVEAWSLWAAKAQVDPRVIGYLNVFQGSIHKFESNMKEKAFATPRSWEFVSDLISDIPTKDVASLKLYASTLVGVGEANAFITFLKLRSKLRPVKDYFTQAATIKLPEKTDLQWALVTSIVEYYKSHMGDKNALTILGQYIDLIARFSEEYSVFTLKMTFAFDPKIQTKLQKIPKANKLAHKLWKFIM